MSAISEKQAFAAVGASVAGPSAPRRSASLIGADRSASGAARKSVGLAYVCHGLYMNRFYVTLLYDKLALITPDRAKTRLHVFINSRS
jgi:hypothetical protein